jgi:uncharacterized membrane protein
MKDVIYAVVVAAFQDEKAADGALKQLKAERKETGIKVKEAAMIKKDADGKLHIKETADSGGGKGAGIGLVVGGAIGLIGGPLGVGVGSAAGAFVGGLAAKFHDSGIKNDELRKIGADLPAGGSALVVVINPDWVDEVEKELSAAGAQVSTTGIAAEIAEQLRKAAADKEAELDSGLVYKEGVDSFKSSVEIENRADE